MPLVASSHLPRSIDWADRRMGGSTDTCPIGFRRRGNGAWRLDRRRRYIVRLSWHARWDRRLAHHPLGDGRARGAWFARGAGSDGVNADVGALVNVLPKGRTTPYVGLAFGLYRATIDSGATVSTFYRTRMQQGLGGRRQPSDVHRSCLAR